MENSEMPLGSAEILPRHCAPEKNHRLCAAGLKLLEPCIREQQIGKHVLYLRREARVGGQTRASDKYS